jgi:hypothetical protein
LTSFRNSDFNNTSAAREGKKINTMYFTIVRKLNTALNSLTAVLLLVVCADG